MTHKPRAGYFGRAAIGAGLIAAPLYVVMITITLAHIQEVSGQIPFDLRPMGYTPQDAAALLDALGAEGRAYYLGRQIPLDMVYPGMIALTLAAAFLWFGQHLPNRRLIRLGIVFSMGGALFDYAENIGIVAMIHGWPNPSVGLIYAASTATIAKSACTTLAIILLLGVGFLWARRSIATLRS